MFAYALRRIALLIPLLIGIVVIVFALMQLIPGDPAVVLLGQDATPQAVTEMRHALGLDRPVAMQLGRYLANVARGDLGQSIFRGEPVLTAIMDRLPATIEIAVMALGIAVVLGIVIGVASALRRGSLLDAGAMVFAQLGVSMPVFWLGILLMFAFAVRLNWLPAVGRGEPLWLATRFALTGRPGALIESLRYLTLPALTLALPSAAMMSRVVRASMLEAMRQPFVRTARSKGLSGRAVVVEHALRNAVLPVVSIIGLRFGELLGGAVLTESIFGWPGLGQLAVTAISQRDIPLVQGVVLIFAGLFALVTLSVDLLNAHLDPRARAA
jgi:peptide/nickel transport system permease protein